MHLIIALSKPRFQPTLAMPNVSKRKSHLKRASQAANIKRARAEVAETEPNAMNDTLEEAQASNDLDVLPEWEEEESDDEEIHRETDAFQKLVAENNWDTASIKYHRGPGLSERQQRRHRAEQLSQQEVAQSHSQPITNFFSRRPDEPSTARLNSQQVVATETPQAIEDARKESLEELKEHLRKTENKMRPDLKTRCRAVLAFMNLSAQQKKPRKELALVIAQSLGRGPYFAEQLIKYEKSWVSTRTIPETQKGSANKARSWLEDEGVMLAARDHIAFRGTGEYY